jgi:hypothetical protein
MDEEKSKVRVRYHDFDFMSNPPLGEVTLDHNSFENSSTLSQVMRSTK